MWKRLALVSLGIFAFSLWLFYPALQNGLVNWDDLTYLTENAQVRNLSWTSVGWFFTNVHHSNWHPLTSLSFAFDYAMWGEDPYHFHLTGIVLHALNAAVLFLLAFRLLGVAGGKPERAGWQLFACAVFAVVHASHPLRVESVAWVSERKDLLYALFYLLAILAYFSYVETAGARRRRWFLAVTLLFSLSLLSKPMALTLPVVLVLLDLYPLKRIGPIRDWRTWRTPVLEKIPLLALAGVSAATTVWAQTEGIAVKSLGVVDLPARLGSALYSSMFYLAKMFLPWKLAPFYPHPALSPHRISLGLYLLSFACFSAVCWLAVRQWPRDRLLGVSWLAYLVMLLPVCGLVHIGGHIAADRYTYVPLAAPLLLLGIRAATFLNERGTGVRWAAVSLLCAYMVFIGVQTRRQITVWEDSISLWDHAIALYPDSDALLYYSRGMAHENERGDDARALADYTRAIELNPNHYDALVARGIVRGKMGRRAESMRDFDRAIAINGQNSRAFGNRGTLHHFMGNYDEALSDYLRSLEIDPQNAVTHHNIAMIYESKGMVAEAQRHSEAARAIGLPPSPQQR
jgi:tetratricopeptide (TPR) repeat protein